MTVPYTFAGATAAIPLSQLDSNFATAITLGNTAVYLGNTTTSIGNLTLANVTISSVSTPITAAQGGTGLSAPGTAGNVLTSNGTAWTSTAPTAQVYPGAGIANSTGSAWGTSYTTSGSGTVVALATTPSLTNPTITSYTETVYSLSGTAIDPANGTIQTKTLSANTTFTESLADGQSVVLMLNPSTYSVTWPTMTWINTTGSGSAPTLEASSTNVIVMWQVSGTVYGNWAGSA